MSSRGTYEDITAAESTSPTPEAPGVGAKYSRNMTRVWTSRMSTKLAWMPSGAEGHVAGQQLVGVGGTGEDRGPEQRQPAPRAVERHHALMGLVDAPRSFSSRSATRRLRRPTALGGAVDQIAHQRGEEHDDGHQHADAGDDRRGCRGTDRTARGPSTLPRWPSERPAPKTTASGPAMAKNRMVATKLMKVEVTATGSGTP